MQNDFSDKDHCSQNTNTKLCMRKEISNFTKKTVSMLFCNFTDSLVFCVFNNSDTFFYSN